MTLTGQTYPNMNTGYFGNYQLLGDSQFVRFCVEILDLKSTLDEKRRSQIGFCISGQDSTELARLVAKNSHCLEDNLIIMIGTNDVKKQVPRCTFIKALYSLKSLLEWKNVIWLTIPPIPKFIDSEKHIKKLNFFNNDIMRLRSNNIKVLDTYSLFIDEYYKRPRVYCFEEYFYSKMPPYRRDDIHLNKKGLLKLCTWLCFHLLPEKLDVIQNYRDRTGDCRIKLYQEYLYLSSLLPNSSDVTREELYFYIMGPPKTNS